MRTDEPETITTDYQISERHKSYFRRNGFIKLRQVLDPEQLKWFAPVISEKVIELNTKDVPLEQRDTYGKAFLQVTNIWKQDPVVARFARSPDLARLATELLGVKSVRMFHDQALYKEPSGGITPWHADQYYWPFSTDRCVTVWIPLQETGPDMGPLAFAAGSHEVDLGRNLGISDESETKISEQLLDQGFVVDDSPYALGDLSYHLGWTFHRAGANQSAQPRKVMTMIYVDAEMVLSEPTNSEQENDLRLWFPGQQPGEVIGTELNPVLYPVG